MARETDSRFLTSSLTVESDDLLVVHAGHVDPDGIEDLIAALRSELPGHKIVVLAGGIRLEALTDDQLREIGLERIAD